MKTINVTFDRYEISQLESLKGDCSWHDFILFLARKRGKNGKDKQKRI